jgi:hypothetical protein
MWLMNEHHSSLPCWYCGCDTPHTAHRVSQLTVIDCDACGAGEITIEPLSYRVDGGLDGVLKWVPRTRYAFPPEMDPIPRVFLEAFAGG